MSITQSTQQSQRSTQNQQQQTLTAPTDPTELQKQDEQRAKRSDQSARVQVESLIKQLVAFGDVSRDIKKYLIYSDTPTANEIRSMLLRRGFEKDQKDRANENNEKKLSHEAGIVLDSLVGVGSAQSIAMREAAVHNLLGRENTEERPEPWTLGLLWSFQGALTPEGQHALNNILSMPLSQLLGNTPGKPGLNNFSMWSAVADTSESDAAVEARSFATSQDTWLALATRGSDCELAWKIRDAFITETPLKVYSLGGLNNGQAWALRNQFFEECKASWKEKLEQRKATEETDPLPYNEDVLGLLRDLQGIETPSSITFRQNIRTQINASPLAVYSSLTGAKTAAGGALRQKMLQEVSENLATINPAEVVEAIRGDNSPEAWSIRDKYLSGKVGEITPALHVNDAGYSSEDMQAVHISPELLREAAIYSIGALTSGSTEKAEAFIAQAIKLKVPAESILLAARGSELESVWKLRDEVFNTLKDADRIHTRTRAEMLESFPEEKKKMFIAQLQRQWKANGLTDMDRLSDEEVITKLKAVEISAEGNLMDIKMDPYFRVKSAVRDVETGELRDWYDDSMIWANVCSLYDDREHEVNALTNSLRGLTSTRAGIMCQALTKEGMSDEKLLTAIGGVFTPEANIIRSRFTRSIMTISNSYLRFEFCSRVFDSFQAALPSYNEDFKRELTFMYGTLGDDRPDLKKVVRGTFYQDHTPPDNGGGYGGGDIPPA